MVVQDWQIMNSDKNGDDDAFSTKSNQGSSAAASSNAEMPAPPDGGWGWFVVFGSFMIHVVGKRVYEHSYSDTTVLTCSKQEGRGIGQCPIF